MLNKRYSEILVYHFRLSRQVSWINRMNDWGRALIFKAMQVLQNLPCHINFMDGLVELFVFSRWLKLKISQLYTISFINSSWSFLHYCIYGSLVSRTYLFHKVEHGALQTPWTSTRANQTILTSQCRDTLFKELKGTWIVIVMWLYPSY